LACLGRHTVSGLLCACGRQFVDWSADYRVFSQYKWDVRKLFIPIIRGVLDLSPRNTPFVAALDDTHLRKTGARIPGVGYRRDPLSPAFHCNLIRTQRFMQVSALLSVSDKAGPARAIPIRYDHVPPVPKPRRSAPSEEWKAYRKQCRIENLSAHAVSVIRQTRKELDERHGAKSRQFVVAVDGSYTNKTVTQGLPERSTLIGRIRKDAKLHYPPGDEDQPPVGKKRRYGRRAPTPEELLRDEQHQWHYLDLYAAGKNHTFRVKTISPILWNKAGAKRNLRLVAIAPVGYRLRKGSKLLYRKPAFLICTDPDLPLEKIVQYYVWRWDIEVNHRDEKQIIGVGQAQVRSEKAVDRQPAFAVASYAMLLLAAARAYPTDSAQGTLPQPKWRKNKPKQRLPTQELIRQLRSEIWNYALDLRGMSLGSLSSEALCQRTASAHCTGLRKSADNSDDFVTDTPACTKPLKLRLPLASTVLYASMG